MSQRPSDNKDGERPLPELGAGGKRGANSGYSFCKGIYALTGAQVVTEICEDECGEEVSGQTWCGALAGTWFVRTV